MRVLSRYILLEALVFFLISLTAFTGILFTFRILKLTSLIINKGVEFSQVATVFISIIPTFLEIALPLAALLGVMLAFARMSGDSEVVVIRASGISLYEIIWPIVLFGLIVLNGTLIVSHYLKPYGYKSLNQVLFDIARTKTTAGLDAGVFNDLGRLTLYSEEIDHASGRLKGVLIDDKRDPEQRKVITALQGRITSNPDDRNITFHLENGQIHELAGNKYLLTEYVENEIATNPKELQDPTQQERSTRPRELLFSELSSELSFNRSILNNDRVVQYLVQEERLPIQVIDEETVEETTEELIRRNRQIQFEQANRFALPLAAFLLALAGMPLGIQQPRTQNTWGIGLSACIGMVVFVGYFGFLSLGQILAEGGSVPPGLAAWIPNVAVVILTSYMFVQMGTEKWQSITQGIEEGLKRMGDRFARLYNRA